MRGRQMLYRIVVSAVIVCMAGMLQPVQAQVTRFIQNGNSLYGQKKYKEAAADYEKAVSRNPNYAPAWYNLGNTLYEQKKYDTSRMVLQHSLELAKDKQTKASTNYNIGNTYMAEQKWEDAIDAYKKTLRSNPQDADAKYNLSYATQMLKKQQQQDKKNDKNKDKNKDKDKQDKDKKDKKDKDKDKQDKKDQQDKDNEQNDKQDEKEKRPKPQPSKLSKQQAEQLLNALQQEEKKLQDKMKKEKGVPVKMDKDW